MNELVKRCVAWRAVSRIADLQHVLGRIFRVHSELVNGPRFDRTNTSAGWKRMLGGFVQEMDGGIDAMATTDMDTPPVLQPMHRFVTLAAKVLLGFVDENSAFCIDLNAQSRKSVVKRA
jgi:hypothetical protein